MNKKLLSVILIVSMTVNYFIPCVKVFANSVDMVKRDIDYSKFEMEFDCNKGINTTNYEFDNIVSNDDKNNAISNEIIENIYEKYDENEKLNAKFSSENDFIESSLDDVIKNSNFDEEKDIKEIDENINDFVNGCVDAKNIVICEEEVISSVSDIERTDDCDYGNSFTLLEDTGLDTIDKIEVTTSTASEIKFSNIDYYVANISTESESKIVSIEGCDNKATNSVLNIALFGTTLGTTHILPRDWYDGSGNSKTGVTKICFIKGGEIPTGYSWNISSSGLMGYQSGSIVTIYAPNSNDIIKSSNTCNHLFAGYGTDILTNDFRNLVEIVNLNYLDTSDCTTMNGMFSGCNSLISMDLSSFNTSNVTDMVVMFKNCSQIESLDLSSFDTNSVTDCGSMFHTCTNLQKIYVSTAFDLSNATNHSVMFSGDTSLIGQNGTQCNGTTYIDKTYARLDGGPTSSTPGYFSLKPGVTISSISVATKPVKLSYKAGEKFDPTGLVIHKHYDDGHIEDVVYNSTTAAEFIFNPATTSDLTIADTQVTITHSGQSCNQNITIIEPASISVKPNTNLKVKYAINESFDPTNLYINVTYSDTTTIETVSYTGNESDFSFNPSILDTAGASIPVTITWTNNGNDFTCTQNVEVVELSTISVNLPPTTTRYIRGTNFDPTGLKINLNYSDSTTDTVTYSTSTSGGFTFNGESTLILNTVGNPFVITIGYAGKTCTQNVIVAELSSISITTHATKLNYNAGETFDPTGLVITLTYSDNVTEPITYTTTTSTDFTFSPSGPLTRTGNVITVQYKTFDTMTMEETLNVKELTSITIVTNPTKLSYAIGQSLNSNGLVLTLTYTDSNNAVTTDTATYNSTTQNKFAFNPSGTAITTGNVIVTYDGKTGVNMQPTFPITVRQVASISVVNRPSTTSYNAGAKLNPNGLSIRVNYEGGTSEIVSYSSNNASDFIFNPSTSTSLNTGHSSVTVTYGGKSKSFAISVTQSSGGYVPSGGGGNNGGGGGGGGGGGVGLPKTTPIKYIDSNYDEVSKIRSAEVNWEYNSLTNSWELVFANGSGIAKQGFYTITYVAKENINGLEVEKAIYKTYYFDSNGQMFYGWLHTLDNNWYFFDIDIANLGTMIVSSWKKIDGKWYYFDKDGKLLINTITPDGCIVDENGAWIE